MGRLWSDLGPIKSKLLDHRLCSHCSKYVLQKNSTARLKNSTDGSAAAYVCAFSQLWQHHHLNSLARLFPSSALFPWELRWPGLTWDKERIQRSSQKYKKTESKFSKSGSSLHFGQKNAMKMNVLPAGQLVSVGTCRIRKNKEIKGGLNEKDIPKSFVKYFLYSTLSSIKLTSEAHFKVVTQHFFQKKFRNCSRKIKRVLELQPFQSFYQFLFLYQVWRKYSKYMLCN